ncbi:MAG TPA: LemA family protein [Bacilli bacterium]|nr:LemA family protein [Bacilli bacterium]HPZ23737.1 LemA family protein [Bacilli bacterium]HQC83582.1 LemA family protein [Bacilli bacterium]
MTIIILLTIAIIITLLISTYIKSLSSLEFYKIRIQKAQEEIEKELNNRYELIKDASDIIEKNTKIDLKDYHELKDMKEKNNISTIELDKKETASIKTIYLLSNDYPKISKKKEFKDDLRKLNESDTKITAAKSFYNENNTNLNNLLKKFPTSIIGIINKYKPQGQYEVEIVIADSKIV